MGKIKDDVFLGSDEKFNQKLEMFAKNTMLGKQPWQGSYCVCGERINGSSLFFLLIT